MKQFLLYLFLLTSVLSNAQINKYIRKATKATTKSNFEKARRYYLQAYNLDKTNYNANEGLGVVLADFMGRYEEAIPYLETALQRSPQDTSMDVVYALGKSYQHIGQYEKALAMFSRLDKTVATVDDNELYHMDINKRKADCHYAIEHCNVKQPGSFYILNVGPTINTAMPEYVPVITPNNEMIFTSRRQDSPEEQIQKEDGKYYESMYLSPLVNGRPQSIRRYTVPDLYMKSNFRKHHESIISMSPDGKTLFVFRDAKIYEVKTDALTKSQPSKLAKTINSNYYQSHAYLSKDGNTLLFTSETDNGIGGIDIYKSVKGSNGQWEKPTNLGPVINTPHDEDSPYLSDDGNTLYFASKGHPGYGNFDLYKSELKNGAWTEPENLGQPINSPAHDIFMNYDNSGNAAYFSSSRQGGYGDMDIYKINYLNNFKKECSGTNSLLVTIKPGIDSLRGLVNFETVLPQHINVLSYQWTFNGIEISKEQSASTAITNKDAENNLAVKIIAWCDTCFEPLAICNSININFPKTTNPVIAIDTTKATNLYDKNLSYTYINEQKAIAMGFNLAPVHFSLNKSNVREDAISILNTNVTALINHKEIAALIYGFADAEGSDSYNKQLSLNRAKQVKQYLLSKGVNPKQIKLVAGKGEQFLVNGCTNDVECDDAQHEQNRRVEIVLVENK